MMFYEVSATFYEKHFIKKLNHKCKAYIFLCFSLIKFLGLADFGGMLGVFFGASVISLIEIFYFLTSKLMKHNFNTEEQTKESEFGNESTIHGVYFIFNFSFYKFIRLLWFLVLLLAFSGCLLSSREKFKKMIVKPEITSILKQKRIEEIPFPAITICDFFMVGKIIIVAFSLVNFNIFCL